MRMMMTALCAFLLVPFIGLAQVTLGEYPAAEFSPARGQLFEIPFHLKAPMEVEIRLYTADGNLVRSLRAEGALGPGAHSLQWDGRDENGTVVPDEAYVPVLVAKNDKGEETYDPRRISGGEVVGDLNVGVTGPQEIAYDLPAPCRVLIRAGIKGGPMLRSLATWAPRAGGRNVQRWDGMDQDGLVDLRQEKGLTVLVTAFRLPLGSILTVGNPLSSYSEYRHSRNWPDPEIHPEEMTLARKGVRISRQHYSPRYQDADPKVTLGFAAQLPLSDKSGLPVVRAGQSIPVRVDIAGEDLWLMNESLYEVAFFIDHQFISEEEQGYVPLTWLWEVQGLSPGKHLLTTNISGFGGKVGVASLLFEVSE